jgi:hypothetical protein
MTGVDKEAATKIEINPGVASEKIVKIRIDIPISEYF